MKHYYEDILSRISEPPAWFDEHGTPRYGDFAPNRLSDIYAVEACLLLIRCQNCGTEFKVGMSFSRYAILLKQARADLKDLIVSNAIHYGDPPNMRCCPAGPTMNSVPMRVLEFWLFGDKAMKWKRMPDLEREIKCNWADEEVLPKEPGKT